VAGTEGGMANGKKWQKKGGGLAAPERASCYIKVSTKKSPKNIFKEKAQNLPVIVRLKISGQRVTIVRVHIRTILQPKA